LSPCISNPHHYNRPYIIMKYGSRSISNDVSNCMPVLLDERCGIRQPLDSMDYGNIIRPATDEYTKVRCLSKVLFGPRKSRP
jgi:hypothetical protein